jgi:hypothetical protein
MKNLAVLSDSNNVVASSGPDFIISKIFSPKNLTITLALKINAIFHRILTKIAEKCDHNIDPWS